MLALAKQSPQRAVDVRDDRPVLRRWRGPINIRAMIAALPPDACRVISDLILADKMNYSLLLNFALRVDGVRGQERIIDETSFALQRPLDHATAQLLFDALFESGWVSAAFGDRL